MDFEGNMRRSGGTAARWVMTELCSSAARDRVTRTYDR